MLNRQGLIDFFNLKPAANALRFVIYASEKSERLDYACRFIFNHGLKVNYSIVNNESEFEQASGIKINYSTKLFQNSLQIIPNGLLEEKTLRKEKPQAFFQGNMIYLFPSVESNATTLHFDLFSAVFYCISRYEEWQEHVKDQHGRFEAAQGLFYQNNFHQKCILEMWLNELAEKLKPQTAGKQLPERIFKVMSTIDVDNLFAYRAKGFLRIVGACVKDVIKGDLKNLKERTAVLSGKKQDPFDVYETVSDFCFEQKIPLIYFFLYRTGTKYDRTVDPDSPAFEEVFEKVIKNHAAIGIHPSYDASVAPEILKQELNKIRSKSNKTISFSRQHFLRFNIRTTPRELIDNGIEVDFSMGFASEQGLRAGTTLPFYFYDFDNEKSGDLLFVPFCTMDGVFTVYKNISSEKAFESMLRFAEEIKSVGGNFVSVFHERSFSDHLYPGFGTLYKNLHLKLKAL
ncbi:MAG: hypothetical protein JNL60_06315 [Bacteroidia bacterium]|nr:hypothetical protein [Bacteroidia bacterium]